MSSFKRGVGLGLIVALLFDYAGMIPFGNYLVSYKLPILLIIAILLIMSKE